jgi:hypothetical protein
MVIHVNIFFFDVLDSTTCFKYGSYRVSRGALEDAVAAAYTTVRMSHEPSDPRLQRRSSMLGFDASLPLKASNARYVDGCIKLQFSFIFFLLCQRNIHWWRTR